MNQKITIVVVGAYPSLQNGVWKSGGVDGFGDHAGATFDRFRILVGAELAKRFPDAQLLLSGGAQPDAPSCAEIAKRELIELGVSESRLILEEQSRSVHQQLYFIAKMAQERNLGHLLVVTNDWHHPRLKAMMDHAPKMEAWKTVSWEPIEAEKIMLESGNPEWGNMAALERTHPKFFERVQMEQQGIKQVVDGTYRYLPFAAE